MLTKEFITEGNTLIGKFMNYTEGYDKHDVWQKFQYNSSWDWLMPVLDKIESLRYDVVIVGNQCRINSMHYLNHHANKKYSIEKFGDSKIEAVWIAVVEFIKYYNE